MAAQSPVLTTTAAASPLATPTRSRGAREVRSKPSRASDPHERLSRPNGPSKKRKSDELRERTLKSIAKTSKPFAEQRSEYFADKAAEAANKETPRGLHTTMEADESVIFLGEQSLGLEKTVPRRRSWTPVAGDQQPDPFSKDAESTASQANTVDAADCVFSTLGSTYTYSQTDVSNQTAYPSRLARLEHTTRRLVELEYSACPSPQLEIEKRPKPKKRPRTITEKATELYRRDSGLAADTPVTDPTTSRNGLEITQGKNGKRARKGKAAKVGPPRSPLLLPEEACRMHEAQDLVFGTPSQLVKEDSAMTIRDLQNALRLSLEAISESSATDLSTPTSQHSLRRSSVGLKPSSKRLWDAAARDHTGSTVLPEVIDLTDSPHRIAQLSLRASPVLRQPASNATAMASINTESHMKMHRPDPAEDRRRTDEVLPSVPEGEVSTSNLTLPATEDAPAPTPAAATPAAATPDYSQWSDDALKLAIKNYGFKAMRNRKNMVLRLQKCWQAQHPGAVVSVPSASALPSTAAKAPKSAKAAKGKQRPKQAPAAASTSTATPISTIPPTKPDALHHDLILDDEASSILSAATAADAEKSGLFAAIDAAVLASTPLPSTDTQRRGLSWYEKILLYDPIVIEDLTVWLNGGALTAAGVDAEVPPRVVRDWCEARSVCCLWKMNLRGQARSRY